MEAVSDNPYQRRFIAFVVPNCLFHFLFKASTNIIPLSTALSPEYFVNIPPLIVSVTTIKSFFNVVQVEIESTLCSVVVDHVKPELE